MTHIYEKCDKDFSEFVIKHDQIWPDMTIDQNLVTKCDQILSNGTKFMTKMAIKITKNLQQFFIVNDTPSPLEFVSRKFIKIGEDKHLFNSLKVENGKEYDPA